MVQKVVTPGDLIEHPSDAVRRFIDRHVLLLSFWGTANFIRTLTFFRLRRRFPFIVRDNFADRNAERFGQRRSVVLLTLSSGLEQEFRSGLSIARRVMVLECNRMKLGQIP